MTAVLGTPCFGPFAGAAASWATQQPTFIALTAFVSIGVGMAIPYLILTANPRLISFIPRAGPASELVKQIMGLLMLASSAFFIGTGTLSLLAEMPWLREVLHWWVVALFCVLAAIWLVWRTMLITTSGPRRLVFTALATIIALGPTAWARLMTSIEYKHHQNASLWRPYTPEGESAALAQGKTVVVDFTAAWCINCKLLEATVLTDARVLDAFKAENVLLLRADLTSRTADGWQRLRALQERGIPVVTFSGPGKPEPTKLYFGTTIATVLDTIKIAQGETP
jgi:thiol:disulfide interchange protein DsbD